MCRTEGPLCGLIVAAGLSSRMGQFKPLLPLRGKTVIENTVDSMLSGGVDSVTVVTGFRAAELERVLRGRYGWQVRIVRNTEFRTTDMMRSIQIGCAALPSCEAFFLLPGDMPAVHAQTFQMLAAVWRQEKHGVIFPTLDGYRKHPPLVDAALLSEILAFAENGGLRNFWKAHESLVRCVPVQDPGVWIDLDTQRDYQALEQSLQKAASCEPTAVAAG